MAAPTELYVDAFPDMGEMGPSHRRIMHSPCCCRMVIHTHRLTNDHKLYCPGCALRVNVTDDTMHQIEIEAIVQRSSPVVIESQGGETKLVVHIVPLG